MNTDNEMTSEEKNLITTIGFNVANYRKLRNLTQEQLAEKSRIAVNTLRIIEAPFKYQSPSIIILFRIANALEITLDNLLNFDINRID